MWDFKISDNFDLMPMKEMLNELQMSKTTLWRAMYQKETPMPFVKIRGKVFFIKNDIEKWIQQHMHNSEEKADG